MGDIVSSNGTFIDSPVFSIIDYFNRSMNLYLDIALKLGVILALCGLIWNCFQVAFGLMESRKLIVGTVTKWILFVVILVFYPAVTKGLKDFSIQMASYVSGTSIKTLTNGLVNYMKILEDATNIKDENKVEEAIKKLIDNKAQWKEDFIKNSTEYETKHSAEWAWQEELTNLQQQQQNIEKQKQKQEKGTGKFKTINAIKSVLLIEGSNTAPTYKLDISLKDTNGNDTGYLSPNAMIRVSVLAAQIMWEAMWYDDVMATWEDNAKKGLINKKQFTDFPFFKIFDIILCFFAEILMVVITAFELIQYVMCILEFVICVTFGIVLIPCMLFDGLKDMAMKLMPSLLAQAVKLSMITICMFFCFYTYLEMAQNVVGDSGGFSLWHFTYVIFTCLLTFALCTNAPKLACALLTGQPQMSMGEFVQSAAAIAGGTAATISATRGAIGAGSRFTANRLGDAAALVGGYVRGSGQARDEGQRKGGQFVDGVNGAIGTMLNRTGNRVKGAMQNAANYKGGNPLSRFTGGRGGGSGMGGSSGGTSGGTNRFTSNDIPEELKNLVKKNLHSMNYGDHVTNNGSKSTFAEYMKDQYNSGLNGYKPTPKVDKEKPHPDNPGKNNFNPPSLFNGGGGGGISPISPNGGMPVANGNYSTSYKPKQIGNDNDVDTWFGGKLKSAGESTWNG